MSLKIVGGKETLFFSHYQGKLCQWVELTVRSDASIPASVTITAGGRQ